MTRAPTLISAPSHVPSALHVACGAAASHIFSCQPVDKHADRSSGRGKQNCRREAWRAGRFLNTRLIYRPEHLHEPSRASYAFSGRCLPPVPLWADDRVLLTRMEVGHLL